MLPLSLLLRVKTVWLSNDDSIFFHRKWILDGCCKNLLQNLLLCSILWVSLVSEQKNGIRTNPPVANQILCNCLRKGRLLRFQLNCIATSHGPVQKLGNNLWHDCESIIANFCSQWCLKAMSRAGLTGQALVFYSKTFWAIFYWIQSSTELLTNHFKNQISKICQAF